MFNARTASSPGDLVRLKGSSDTKRAEVIHAEGELITVETTHPAIPGVRSRSVTTLAFHHESLLERAEGLQPSVPSPEPEPIAAAKPRQLKTGGTSKIENP